jgi:hypothetical protein
MLLSAGGVYIQVLTGNLKAERRNKKVPVQR